jgi:IclR family pca regulon transcriptional regulator
MSPPPSSDAETAKRADPLYVRSVEKAFRVLTAFGPGTPSLSLAQVAAAAGIDKSAAQRFTHTLERLGYLEREPGTGRLTLAPRSLELGTHYIRASPLAGRAMPFLLDLSRTTEESVSLTVLDDTAVVYVVRFTSRHMVSSDVIVGTRLPAYCTAPGIAMLARLPPEEARLVLERTERRAYTPSTTWGLSELTTKLADTAARGYATAVEELFPGDISLAAAITGADGRGIGAISLSVTRARMTPRKAEQRFAPLVVATAQALSLQVVPSPAMQVRSRTKER